MAAVAALGSVNAIDDAVIIKHSSAATRSAAAAYAAAVIAASSRVAVARDDHATAIKANSITGADPTIAVGYEPFTLASRLLPGIDATARHAVKDHTGPTANDTFSILVVIMLVK